MEPRSCAEDEHMPLGARLLAGDGFKPPQAGVIKSRDGERHGKVAA